MSKKTGIKTRNTARAEPNQKRSVVWLTDPDNFGTLECKGYITLQNHHYYLSETFIGKCMELDFQNEKTVAVCYGNFVVAKIDMDEQLFISKRIFRR